MIHVLARRIMILIPMLFALSVIIFAVIELPPGDYLTTYIAALESQGLQADEAEISRIQRLYALDRPMYVRYVRWISGFLRGDLGRAMATEYAGKQVTDILAERIPLSMGIALASTILVWTVALPIGIYSATHQYSAADYFFTFVGFLGLAVPNFLFAIILMWRVYDTTGFGITGLFSLKYHDAPWTLAKLVDLLKNVWVPLLVLATAGTAGLIRVMRANLLDELHQPYVETARAKGLSERRLLWKYPIRIAFNPIVSTIGWLLPAMVGGEVLVAIVLNLETVGPILLDAVLSQDMQLAGSILMILSVLTVIGTLISDLALVWLDPRIRYDT